MRSKCEKIISVIFISVIFCFFNSIISFAYQIEDNIITNTEFIMNNKNISSIVEYNLMTEEAIEKTYGEVITSLSNEYIENEIAYAEPYYYTESGLSPSAIIDGDDERVGTYDFRICYLDITWQDGCTGHATGFLVGTNCILTSAHCVYGYDIPDEYHQEPHGYAASVKVIPCKIGTLEVFGSTYATNFVMQAVYQDTRKCRL